MFRPANSSGTSLSLSKCSSLGINSPLYHNTITRCVTPHQLANSRWLILYSSLRRQSKLLTSLSVSRLTRISHSPFAVSLPIYYHTTDIYVKHFTNIFQNHQQQKKNTYLTTTSLTACWAIALYVFYYDSLPYQPVLVTTKQQKNNCSPTAGLEPTTQFPLTI